MSTIDSKIEEHVYRKNKDHESCVGRGLSNPTAVWGVTETEMLNSLPMSIVNTGNEENLDNYLKDNPDAEFKFKLTDKVNDLGDKEYKICKLSNKDFNFYAAICISDIELTKGLEVSVIITTSEDLIYLTTITGQSITLYKTILITNE